MQTQKNQKLDQAAQVFFSGSIAEKLAANSQPPAVESDRHSHGKDCGCSENKDQ